MRSRFLFLLGVCVLATAGWWYGLSASSLSQAPSGKELPKKPPLPVEVALPRKAEISSTLAAVGTLKAHESLVLRPEVAGRIESLHFEEGASVHRGDVLVRLNDRLAVAEYKKAEAARALAEINYERARILKDKGIAAISQFDQAQAALKMAEAHRDLTQAEREKMEIRAPFDGVMGLRHVSPGDMVAVGQDLVGFHSINPMKVDFTLPETAAQTVQVGQSIRLEVDAFPGVSFEGVIYAVDPEIQASSRNMLLRARVPNDDARLRPGLFARVQVITGHAVQGLLLPESALVPRGKEHVVFRVTPEHQVQTMPITIGRREQGEVEILSGIKEGDLIVTAGQLKLRDGAQVQYQAP